LKKSSLHIILFLLAVALTGCENDSREIMAIPQQTVIPAQWGKGITILYSDSAELKVKMTAPEMQKFDEAQGTKEPYTVLPKGLYALFYDLEGKASASLKANYGVRYDRSRKMEVKYKVEVINEKGEKLETEHLVWDERTKRITTNEFVKITTGTEIITGQGLESNQDFSEYEIKQITGSFNLDEEVPAH